MLARIKKILVKLINVSALKPHSSVDEIESKSGLLDNFYSILKAIGFQPKHIVDVGANEGSWTREALKHFPNAYYTMLEPQQWMKNSMKDVLESNRKVSFNCCGAGSRPGTFKFTIGERHDSSSFRFSEADAKQYGLRQIEVPVVTLNEFLPKLALPVPDIIKIDTEGLDMEVLKGTDNFFGRTEIFMVEVAVVCKELDNSFLHVINYMDQNGYSLFEITDLNRTVKLKILWLAELVFVKKNGIIDSVKFNYNDNDFLKTVNSIQL